MSRLLVQSGPFRDTKSLETLKEMAERGKGKGGSEESLKALRYVVIGGLVVVPRIVNSSAYRLYMLHFRRLMNLS